MDCKEGEDLEVMRRGHFDRLSDRLRPRWIGAGRPGVDYLGFFWYYWDLGDGRTCKIVGGTGGCLNKRIREHLNNWMKNGTSASSVSSPEMPDMLFWTFLKRLVFLHYFGFLIVHHLVYSSLIKFNSSMRPNEELNRVNLCARNQLLCALSPWDNEQKNQNPYKCRDWKHS